VRFGIFLNELLKLIYSWTVNKVRGSLYVSFFILVLQGTFAKCFPGVIYEERKLDLELFNQQVLAPLSDQLTEVRMIFFRVDLMSFSPGHSKKLQTESSQSKERFKTLQFDQQSVSC
jgi:hypothetical protein